MALRTSSGRTRWEVMHGHQKLVCLGDNSDVTPLIDGGRIAGQAALCPEAR